ncbi:MAG TPA: serine/threonine-protein kinase, partial [Minicystis sp.]|nr:serine/threonine-protein kinase [Minicystis sp.]
MTPRTFGRYEILRPIASGGMATVYLGRALGLGGFQRLIAVKVMHPHYAAEADFVSMFLDEARLAASIRHPNVVATLDVESGPEGLYIVMEYVEGPPLNALIKAARQKGGRLPVPIALRVVLDTLAGLHAAHELTAPDGQPLRLVHRDVSPHNVLVGVDGISRITDFGVARAESRLVSTRDATVKGKVPYMPPEQLGGMVVDRRADVYAVGVVLWELLTGERMIRGEDPGAILAAAMRGPPAAPVDFAPGVPPALSDVCMRALLPHEQRWATAAEFADALESAAAFDHVNPASPRAVGALAKTVAPPPAQLPAAPTAVLPSSDRSSPSGPQPGSNPSQPSHVSQSAQHGPVSEPVQASSFAGATGPFVQSGTTAVPIQQTVAPPAPRRWPQAVVFAVA